MRLVQSASQPGLHIRVTWGHTPCLGPSWTSEVRAVGLAPSTRGFSKPQRTAQRSSPVNCCPGDRGTWARWLEAARLACPGRGEEGGVSCWGATAGKPWGRGFQTCFDVIKHLAVSVLDLAHGAHFSCPSKLGHFRTVTATNSAASRLPGLVERTCAARQAPLQRLLLAGLGSRVARRSPSRSCLKEGNRLREAGGLLGPEVCA